MYKNGCCLAMNDISNTIIMPTLKKKTNEITHRIYV